MAGKKSFATQQNPALAFISVQEAAPQEAEDNNASATNDAKKAAEAPQKNRLRIKKSGAPEGWRYVTLEEMDALALPTAVGKAAAIVREKLKGGDLYAQDGPGAENP